MKIFSPKKGFLFLIMNVVWYNFIVYSKVRKCNPAYILGLPSASTVPSQTPPRCLKPPLPPPHPLIIIILRSPPPHPQGAWPTTATLLQSSSDLPFKVECSGLQVHSESCGVPTRVSRDACNAPPLVTVVSIGIHPVYFLISPALFLYFWRQNIDVWNSTAFHRLVACSHVRDTSYTLRRPCLKTSGTHRLKHFWRRWS
jgi:hypothetical protein